mgnify:CR=1 FL=1
MKKILILGCPVSGKSTFAERLHALSKVPVFHLDNMFWKADKTHIGADEFDALLSELILTDSWIIDGDYRRTYEMRIAACDTVFFLDYGTEVCLKGISDRIGRKHSDLPWIENEPDPQLAEAVKQYGSQNKPILLELFRKYRKDVITFHCREEAEEWLNRNFSEEKDTEKGGRMEVRYYSAQEILSLYEDELNKNEAGNQLIIGNLLYTLDAQEIGLQTDPGNAFGVILKDESVLYFFCNFLPFNLVASPNGRIEEEDEAQAAVMFAKRVDEDRLPIQGIQRTKKKRRNTQDRNVCRDFRIKTVSPGSMKSKGRLSV